MKKIFPVFLVLIFVATNVFAQFSVGKKDESDVILGAVTNAAKQVLSLSGLQNAKKVGVLVIRDPLAEPISFPTMKISSDISDFFPILHLFKRKQYTTYSSAKVPQGETEMSHSPLIEDQIVTELLNSNKFEVVETIPPFYGNLQQLMIEQQSLDKIIEDPSKMANIGKVLGVDTMIVGSAGGSIMKYITKEDFMYRKDYFVVSVRLNLRTVDVKTGKVTSSILCSGNDSAMISSQFKSESIMLLLEDIIILKGLVR